MAKVQLTRTDVDPAYAEAGQTVSVTATIDVISWWDVSLNAWLNVYVKETGTGIIYWSDVLRFGISATKTGTFVMPSQNVTVIFEALYHDGTNWIKDVTTYKSVTLKIVKERTSMGLSVSHIGAETWRARANLFTSPTYIPLSGKTIKFYRNGTYLGSAVTGADGYASITFKPPAGRWTILAKFEGDDRYYPWQISAMIDVIVAEEIATKFTDVKVDKTTVYEGDVVTISAYLKDINNNPLPNAPVRSYHEYAYTTIYTDATGRCVRTFYVPKMPAGTVFNFYFKYMGGTIDTVVYKASTSSAVYVTLEEEVEEVPDAGYIVKGTYPSTAIAGSSVKVNFRVYITAPGWTFHDHYQFIVDADTGQALKGNYTSGIGVYDRAEDVTFTMPNKNINFKLELWTEIPPKYSGVPVEKIT